MLLLLTHTELDTCTSVNDLKSNVTVALQNAQQQNILPVSVIIRQNMQ